MTDNATPSSSRAPAGATDKEVPPTMNQGGVNVDRDPSAEPLPEVDTNDRPATPPPPPVPSVNQVFAALQTLSPGSQKLVRDTLTNTLRDKPLPDTVAAPKLLFSSANESLSSSFSNTGYGIHPFLVSLAENGSHIPLSLFTTSATNKLHTEEALIPQKTVINRTSGLKRHIIDIKHFPLEAAMDIGDWHEAWTRYHRFIEKHGDDEAALRWKLHHEFLSQQDNLKRDFTSILKFDIEVRTRYNLNPSAHDEDSYRRRFEAIKLEVLQAEILAAKAASVAESSGNTSSSWKAKQRYNPYPSRDTESSSRNFGSRTDNAVASSSGHSFRAAGASSANTPICLICQRDHRFSTCQESVTQTGKPTTAKYNDNRKLVR
ncbi:hypothetical protein GALMADRAFT_208594 [Galerina marginata CBS 339.88]|uniref:Uncharacterized protein n=1 Tax=Galerina marginata (strain CBS 339.88) TaxID=685588 RepID=A0A067TGT4_GALM3|nr:hypothetical protein GALMADRAFT_208594 [Galerina marginata CBS 339.88]